MLQANQIYKCSVCGNVVELIRVGRGELVCCGQPMELMEANTADGAGEKHVPVVEKTATGLKVKIGAAPHPMEASHYIEWIQVLADGQSYRQFLRPGQAPEAEFPLSAEQVTAREYCNLHGLWSN